MRAARSRCDSVRERVRAEGGVSVCSGRSGGCTGRIERVRRAYLLTTGRRPDSDEEAMALEFLSKPATSGMSRWEQYAQVLLVSNEMLYVD